MKCIYKVDGRAAYLCESPDNSLVILKKIMTRFVSKEEKSELLREAEILKIL